MVVVPSIISRIIPRIGIIPMIIHHVDFFQTNDYQWLSSSSIVIIPTIISIIPTITLMIIPITSNIIVIIIVIAIIIAIIRGMGLSSSL